MLDTARETVGKPVPGSGVQVMAAWSSEMAMMPSFFLKAALPLGVAMVMAEVSGSDGDMASSWTSCGGWWQSCTNSVTFTQNCRRRLDLVDLVLLHLIPLRDHWMERWVGSTRIRSTIADL